MSNCVQKKFWYWGLPLASRQYVPCSPKDCCFSSRRTKMAALHKFWLPSGAIGSMSLEGKPDLHYTANNYIHYLSSNSLCFAVQHL